jgi:ABC-type lipoprotein release transport system permease subunit
MESLLYGLKPRDPLTCAGALLMVSLAAGLLPVRQARSIAPIEALRIE